MLNWKKASKVVDMLHIADQIVTIPTMIQATIAECHHSLDIIYFIKSTAIHFLSPYKN